MALTIFGSVLHRLSPGQPCPPPEPELVTYTLAKVQTNAPMYPPTMESLQAHPTYFLWVAALLLVPVSRLVCLALQCPHHTVRVPVGPSMSAGKANPRISRYQGGLRAHCGVRGRATCSCLRGMDHRSCLLGRM